MVRSSTGKREKWIDACRGVGIILVMLGHRLPYPDHRWLIAGFHMPYFFILSGYLFRKSTDYKALALKLFRRYLAPYYIFEAINIVLDILIRNFYDKSFVFADEPYSIVRALAAQQPIQGAGPLWFLPALALSLFLYNLIENLSRSETEKFLVMAVLGIFSLNSEVLMPFNLQSVFTGVIFVYAGNLIRKNNLIAGQSEIKHAANRLFLVLSAFSVGYAAIRSNYEISGRMINMSDGCYNNTFLFITGSVTFSYFVFSVVYGISCFDLAFTGKLVNFFANLGRHTIFIVAFESLSITVFHRLADRLPNLNTWYFNFIFCSFFITVLYAMWRLMIRCLPEGGFKELLNV